MAAQPEFYEVWDDSTGNRLGEFDTLAEARSLLEAVLSEQGEEAVRPLAVLAFTPQRGPEDADLSAETVLEGVELLALARGERVSRPAS
ncbi:MAG: hypothetical protein IT306_30480 [Chloroflexi bacterium]|nr:hypothetical protein [Chloroflexota bacterium]